jgi:phospholipase/carboxylesterase
LSAIDPPIVRAPARSASASVIWLHGLGADGHDFEPIASELESVTGHTRFIFPNAPMIPVTINQGYVMRAWYDISQSGGEIVSDEAGIRASSDYLDELIEAEYSAGIPYERIIIAGFSQGGAIAQHSALRFPHRLAGLMALSTYLPMPQALAEEASEANRDISVFLAHGEHDPMIALTRAQASRTHLEALNYSVQWHTYPMEHAVSPQEIMDIDAWLESMIPASA